MKKRLLTICFTFSASLILLSGSAPVNSSSASRCEKRRFTGRRRSASSAHAKAQTRWSYNGGWRAPAPANTKTETWSSSSRLGSVSLRRFSFFLLIL